MKIFEIFENLSKKELESYKYLGFILIVADIFGVFWYLKARKIGIAILIVLIIFLSIILIYERRKDEENPKKDKKNSKMGKIEELEQELKELKDKEKKKNSKDPDEGEIEEEGYDFGIPDAAEYNERLKKAVGF